jgi:GNAT superfamily N-acetyltransferase
LLEAAAVTGFRPTAVQIFRPYADEAPWSLLAESGVDEHDLVARLSRDETRIAKHDGRVVGAYGLRPLTDVRHELVALAVAEGFRRQGLGRWLLGHALGVAESRGAREVAVAACARGLPVAARRLLTGSGFVCGADGWLLELTPE